MGKQSKKKGNFLTSAHQALQRKGVVTTVYPVSYTHLTLPTILRV